MAKDAEESLGFNLLFYNDYRSVWLNVGAVSDSQIDPQLTAACQSASYLHFGTECSDFYLKFQS
jgi:hypothetical protein